ncbi:carbohydrate-binding module family 13 protein [Athelia psychrophila]|uniref:Carbohydrate-binding module family 13 protein n=1 Tax=Athelia psychrophila TaxID=1759441 RepID=A0A166FV07_9AGAM|nr:carbohydrate-binding module family 13 protein [Fibularhizoctonia sp. CBS 109695]
MFNKSALISAVLLAAGASAYTYPSFEGNLLIQVGANNAKCLRADNTNGAPVTVTDCTGGSDQEWKFGPNGNVALYGGKMCLDVTGGVDADGTKLQVWACGTKNKNQQWNYTKYGDNHLKSALPAARCLDLTDGTTTTGNQVQIWGCNGNEDNNNQIWDAGYMANALPTTSEAGQTGVNACGAASSQSSLCQTMWINDVDDFCLWAPRADYVQVMGVGDLTKINVQAGDEGGELDPHGSDSGGEPQFGLVFGSTFSADLQYGEWTSFVSATQFCMRACTGPNARENCQHTHDYRFEHAENPATHAKRKDTRWEEDNELPKGEEHKSTGGESPPSGRLRYFHRAPGHLADADRAPDRGVLELHDDDSVTVSPVNLHHVQDKRNNRWHEAQAHAARITNMPQFF